MGRFVPPTPEQVQLYLDSIGETRFDGDEFVSFYDAVGWMRGKTKITRWKGCVATWRKKADRQEVQRETRFRAGRRVTEGQRDSAAAEHSRRMFSEAMGDSVHGADAGDFWAIVD